MSTSLHSNAGLAWVRTKRFIPAPKTKKDKHVIALSTGRNCDKKFFLCCDSIQELLFLQITMLELNIEIQDRVLGVLPDTEKNPETADVERY